MSAPTSRPATLQDLLALIDALNRKGVEYMLIGGFSMIAHGFSRATRDIDLLFPQDVENGKKVKDVLLLMPEQAAKEIDPAWFAEGENIRVMDEYVVDIMLNANGETYESLLPYRQVVDIHGILYGYLPAIGINPHDVVKKSAAVLYPACYAGWASCPA